MNNRFFALLAALILPLCTATPSGAAASPDPFDLCKSVQGNDWSSDGKEDDTWRALPSSAPIRFGNKSYRSVYYSVDGDVWFGEDATDTGMARTDASAWIAVAELDWTTAGGGWVGDALKQEGTNYSMCVSWNVSGAIQAPSEKTRMNLLLTWSSTGATGQARTNFSGYMQGALDGTTVSSSGTQVNEIHYFHLADVPYRIPYQNQFWLLGSSGDQSAWSTRVAGNGQITVSWPDWTGEQSTWFADFNEVRTGKFVGSCSTTNPSTGCTMTGLTNQTEYAIASRRQGPSGSFYTDADYQTPRSSAFQVWMAKPTVTAEDQACFRVSGVPYGAPIKISGALTLSIVGTIKNGQSGVDEFCHDMIVKPGKYAITATSGKAKASTTAWVADASVASTIVQTGKSAVVKIAGLKPGSFVEASGWRNGTSIDSAWAYDYSGSSGNVSLSVPVTVRGRMQLRIWTGLFDEIDSITVKGY